MIRQEMAELLKKLSLLTQPSLRGSTGIFSKKEIFSELFKTYMNRLNFNVDSEYDISFEPNRGFLTKHCLKQSQNAQKLHPETKSPRYISNN